MSFHEDFARSTILRPVTTFETVNSPWNESGSQTQHGEPSEYQIRSTNPPYAHSGNERLGLRWIIIPNCSHSNWITQALRQHSVRNPLICEDHVLMGLAGSESINLVMNNRFDKNLSSNDSESLTSGIGPRALRKKQNFGKGARL